MSLTRQVIRFGLVGVVNTAVYYGVYLLLHLAMPYVVAHLLAWVVALCCSFLLNCWYTYRVPPTLRRAALYPLTNLPNVLITTFGVVSLVEGLGVSETLAPLVAGLLAVPATFAVTRLILAPRGVPAMADVDAAR